MFNSFYLIIYRLSQPTGGTNDSMKMGSGGYSKQNGAGSNASFMADSVGGSNSNISHPKQLLPDSIDSQTNGKLAEDVSRYLII